VAVFAKWFGREWAERVAREVLFEAKAAAELNARAAAAEGEGEGEGEGTYAS
jgi:hypothetical protein